MQNVEHAMRLQEVKGLLKSQEKEKALNQNFGRIESPEARRINLVAITIKSVVIKFLYDSFCSKIYLLEPFNCNHKNDI